MTNLSSKKILLIDDDDALRQSLGEQLHLHEEFEAAEAETGAQGLEMAKAEYYDAILLDVGLPDIDGREVCRLMRRSGVKSPIIMLTAAESDAFVISSRDAILRIPRGKRIFLWAAHPSAAMYREIARDVSQVVLATVPPRALHVETEEAR